MFQNQFRASIIKKQNTASQIETHKNVDYVQHVRCVITKLGVSSMSVYFNNDIVMTLVLVLCFFFFKKKKVTVYDIQIIVTVSKVIILQLELSFIVHILKNSVSSRAF